MNEFSQTLAYAGVIRRSGEQQHETTAPRSEELATDRTGPARRLVDIVDGGVRHAPAQAPLRVPRFVQEPPECRQVRSSSEDVDCVVHHATDRAELPVQGRHVTGVTLGDRGCGSADPCEEQHQVRVQRLQTIEMQRQRRDAYLAIHQELDALQATMCGQHLILGADGLAKPGLLQVNGFVRQAILGRNRSLERMQRVEKTDHERRTRSNSAACR